MEIKFKDVVLLFEPLKSIGKSAVEVLSSSRPGDALTSYHIGKSVRSLRQAYTEYNEFRKSLIEELGENGQIDPEDTETITELSNRLNEFLELEPEDLKIYPVKPESVNLPPIVFEVAWFLFEDPEAETQGE